MSDDITNERVDKVYTTLKKHVESKGYFLNPDEEFTKDLIRSLMINQHRFGYWACPCRLASGDRKEDQDIICPCVYRDADVKEYDSCYCALYVSKDVVDHIKQPQSIPERRPVEREKRPQFRL